MVEVDEGEETKVDEEAGMGVEVDGLEMGVGVGVEKNLVLAAERAPLTLYGQLFRLWMNNFFVN